MVLPAPFGPEQPEDLAGRDLEVDAVDGQDVAVALDEATDPDDRSVETVPVVTEAMVHAAAGRAASRDGCRARWGRRSRPVDQSMSSAIEPSAAGPASGAGAPSFR